MLAGLGTQRVVARACEATEEMEQEGGAALNNNRQAGDKGRLKDAGQPVNPRKAAGMEVDQWVKKPPPPCLSLTLPTSEHINKLGGLKEPSNTWCLVLLLSLAMPKCWLLQGQELLAKQHRY